MRKHINFKLFHQKFGNNASVLDETNTNRFEPPKLTNEDIIMLSSLLNVNDYVMEDRGNTFGTFAQVVTNIQMTTDIT